MARFCFLHKVKHTRYSRIYSIFRLNMRTWTHELHLYCCSENHFTSFYRFIWEKLRQIQTETETERSSRYPAKIKVRFDMNKLRTKYQIKVPFNLKKLKHMKYISYFCITIVLCKVVFIVYGISCKNIYFSSVFNLYSSVVQHLIWQKGFTVNYCGIIFD